MSRYTIIIPGRSSGKTQAMLEKLPRKGRVIVGTVSLEESLARWEHIKANWKYHKMKCVKPKRKLRSSIKK